MQVNSRHIIDLAKVDKVDDEDLVGKKVHELGILWRLGIPLPNGFVITTKFFKEFLQFTGIDLEIKKIQALDHPSISDSIKKLFHPIRKQIMQTDIPQDLAFELHKFYRKLSGTFKDRYLNVFSSSFNNKSVVFANVKGDANLMLKIKTIWSLSLTEPVAIVVQEDIKSQVKGNIITDNPIIDNQLTKPQMNKLIDYCSTIQKHFYFPKEIDYVIVKDKIYITRIRPFTGKTGELPKQAAQNRKIQKVLIKGVSINHGIVTGPVRIIRENHGNSKIKGGEIIVLPHLDMSTCGKIKRAKAIVINTFLTNSYDKMIYRKDFKMPTIEGARNATRMLQDGNIVTVNGATGEIYSGGLIY